MICPNNDAKFHCRGIIIMNLPQLTQLDGLVTARASSVH